MAYSVEKREFNNSMWICAKDEFLKTAERIEDIEGAKWIWPTTYTRAYIRKNFVIDNISTCYAQFICDNVFDLFINKKPVSLNKKKFSGEITSFLKEGENLINIRAYQSNDDRFFTSAITGIIKNANMCIYTDNSWESYIPVDMWGNDEPENWMSIESKHNNLTLESPIHPRLYKRSLYLRRKFFTEKPIEKATLFATCRGLGEFYINSVRTDNEILSDGISEKYKEYREIDVTPLIKDGENILGVITGNGWLNSESHSKVYMNKNMVLSELYISYVDGTEEVIGTDELWKCNFSPLTDNDLQFGERYDARLEIKNWCESDFDDSLWNDVQCLEADSEIRDYVLRDYPPIYIMRKLKPEKTLVRDTRVIYDFGENCTGRCSILLNNTLKGQEVKISFCERLDEYGEFVVGNYTPIFFNRDAVYEGKALGCMRNFDFYTCKGGKKEYYEPRFAFSGFRYVCVEGIKDKSQVEEITFNVMHNALKRTGKIKSQYSFINELYKATLRTWNNNILNGTINCPTREKNFVAGENHIFSATANYLEDCDDFLARFNDGGRKICTHIYGWGDEKYIIPWTLYKFYRDKGVLELCYKDILNFAYNRVETSYHNLPKEKEGLSDILAPDGLTLDKHFFASCFYCHMLKTVAQIAEVLADYKTSDEFMRLASLAVDAFNEKFFDTEINDYTPQLQSSKVLPLAFGLVPIHRERLLAQRLNDEILKKGHLTTGIVATKYILGVLCDYGYKDTAFMLLDRNKYPSWKNMLKGLNTIPESWVGLYDKSQENSVSMNNFALGTVTGWLFEYLGGIRYRESTPGFSHVVLRPTFIKEIGSFDAEYKSVYGLILTHWHFEGNTVIFNFYAERNVTLILPDGSVSSYPKGEHRVVTTA